LKSKYLHILEDQAYSIALDAGTAEGNEEYLAINARYFESEDATSTKTSLLGLLPFMGSATGESIYKMLTDFYLKDEEANFGSGISSVYQPIMPPT